MAKSRTTIFRYRYGRFMSQYQYDLKRIIDAKKLHLVSTFFQDGTWEALSPQTHVSFIARCARLKPQDVTGERDAKELRCILDSLPTLGNHPRLQQLLLTVLDRLPPAPPPGLEVENLDPYQGLMATKFDPLKDFWRNTTVPPYPGPDQIRTIHEQLVAFPWEEHGHDPILLNQYAIQLNDLAHFYQVQDRGYRLATELFRKKSQVLLRIIEKHQSRAKIFVESMNIIRVRVGSRHGAGLHLLMRDLPEHLRDLYQNGYKRQLQELKCSRP